MTGRGDAILAVRGLRRSFGGIRAANDVALEVRHREIVGLIGPNGSGKSTLFNLVSGAIRPDAGEIL
ncbi:MAG TPA: ATP-binding cassette domain-containing protein, partial [Alphaproteobacteria bacterium]|nr:ATP-binding cassette domain-containing protein [Alphaproteobacteria bacterium]